MRTASPLYGITAGNAPHRMQVFFHWTIDSAACRGISLFSNFENGSGQYTRKFTAKGYEALFFASGSVDGKLFDSDFDAELESK